MNLDDLKRKYEFTCDVHEANPACKFCKGKGERPVKSSPREMTFCICLFVDHDASDEIGTLLGEFASRKLKEMTQ